MFEMDVVVTFFAAMASVFLGVCALISMWICWTAAHKKSKLCPMIDCICCRKHRGKVYVLPAKHTSLRIVHGQDDLVVSYSAGSASKTAAVFHFPSPAEPAREPPYQAGYGHKAEPDKEPSVEYTNAIPPCNQWGLPDEAAANCKILRSVRERMSCFGLSCLRHSQSLPSLLQGRGGDTSCDLEGSSLDDMCSRFDSSVLSFSRQTSCCTECSASGDEFLSLVLSEVQSPGGRSSLWRSAASDTTLSHSPGSVHSFFSLRSSKTLCPECDACSAAPS